MRLRAERDRHVSEPYQAPAIVPTATFEEALREPEAGHCQVTGHRVQWPNEHAEHPTAIVQWVPLTAPVIISQCTRLYSFDLRSATGTSRN
jgi:hypothetical protein